MSGSLGASMRGHRRPYALGRCFGPVHDFGDAAFGHHHDPVTDAKHFRQFARNHQDRDAVFNQLAHDRVDLGFGADIDAARRLVEDQDTRVGLQPFGDDDLLLIAAGKLAGRLLCVAAPDAEALDRIKCPSSLLQRRG